MLTEILITIATTLVGGFSGWFFGRRKYNSEVDQSNIENMKKSLEFYIQISDDYKSRLTEEIKSHNEEVAELKKENAELKREIKEQEKRFDDKLAAQQREITLMKNQMLSVYSQVCLNFNCAERVATKDIHITPKKED